MLERGGDTAERSVEGVPDTGTYWGEHARPPRFFFVLEVAMNDTTKRTLDHLEESYKAMTRMIEGIIPVPKVMGKQAHQAEATLVVELWCKAGGHVRCNSSKSFRLELVEGPPKDGSVTILTGAGYAHVY